MRVAGLLCAYVRLSGSIRRSPRVQARSADAVRPRGGADSGQAEALGRGGRVDRDGDRLRGARDGPVGVLEAVAGDRADDASGPGRPCPARRPSADRRRDAAEAGSTKTPSWEANSR